jgi:xylulokinase
MYTIGYDLGSSSVKCVILDVEKGIPVVSGSYPQAEMEITARMPGWAEQDPAVWWENIVRLTGQLIAKSRIDIEQVKGIGIAYQMHSLVCVGKEKNVLRPAIIWCDSRAVEIGNKAFTKLGKDYSLNNLLNSPGNFTASKLRWVKENEPAVYDKIDKIMLPGDYIAMMLTGEISTTVSGLSEGIFWDFKSHSISKKLLDLYQIDEHVFPKIVQTFSHQGYLTSSAAKELGLREGIPIAYRAGDQPNNALSLNVLNPGEIAATAGTSGVIYGVSDQLRCDARSRVNQFAHVNYAEGVDRLGILLCVNGTGIMNSWAKRNIASGISYEQMNAMAEQNAIGSDGLRVYPFGNGAERMLENRNIGCHINGIDFNRHTTSHMLRAIQEGIAFSLRYGTEIMNEMGLCISVIRAGKANLFLSRTFCETLSNLCDARIELYDTDGAQGAARGAAFGSGIVPSLHDGMRSLKHLETISPAKEKTDRLNELYSGWKSNLEYLLQQHDAK